MLHLINSAGKKLLTGSRRELKEYIKKHELKSYTITENYTEKVVILDKDFRFTTEDKVIPFYKRLFR